MATVTHIMADGTRLNDITGKVIPINEHTEIAYRTLAKIMARMREEKGNGREDRAAGGERASGAGCR